MRVIRRDSFSWLVVSVAVSVITFQSFSQQIPARVQQPKSSTGAGRSAYNASCAACHGLDGRGSDKGVNISDNAKVRHLSDEQLSGIISDGVPGTGMPAFHSLGETQIRAVIRYLRSLQGTASTQTLPGDAKRGKQIFFGKGDCSSCHMISGQGGFLGPDLSVYAAGASAKSIYDEITKRRRIPAYQYQATVLTTSQGDRLEGVIRNEDNFSVQFQSKDGAFHLFQKSELRALDRRETSLMPTDYGERLSSAELNDLTSYLMTVARDADPSTIPEKKRHAE